MEDRFRFSILPQATGEPIEPDGIPDIRTQIENCAKAVEAVQQRSLRNPGA